VLNKWTNTNEQSAYMGQVEVARMLAEVVLDDARKAWGVRVAGAA